ncbi:MAG: PAS domain S-box protein [Verrucomicrobia bacterium]|nr:PAS domain S-box protein [Verrucomicrobiota bacterium]
MPQNPPPAQTVTSQDADIALKRSEEYFDTLVSGIEDYAIFLLSPEGNVISWNAGAQNIKGYMPEEIIGKHHAVFYTPEARQRGLPRHVLHYAANEGKCADEGWRVRKDGSIFWASVVVTALRTQKGALRGFLKITRDLTERRRIEALQTADRQKDAFLATLSHELRTHLTASLGWVKLMRESPKDETITSQGLEVLQRNIETLTALISPLLDLSRIAAGTLTLSFEEVDLKELVHSSVETLQAQAARKGIALSSSVEIPGEVDCKVWGDKIGLQQILANILSNALKFTPEGGAVTVQLRRTQGTAIVMVKDTGRGMSPDFLPLAFKEFAQEKSSHSENGGMGLGLAISKHLVEQHNGSISAESEGRDRGSTFKVELPLIGSVRVGVLTASEEI